MKTIKTTITAAAAWLLVASATQSFAALTNNLAAYWPMDIAVGCNNQTPDVINGYNLGVCVGPGGATAVTLTNFNSNIYLTNDAVRGNAIYVNNAGLGGGAAMYLAFQSVNTNDLAPVNRRSPSSNTVSFWMKTNGDHPAANNDQRMWTESSYPRNLAAVFNLSPVGAGYDIFLRQNGTAGATNNQYGNFSGGSHTTGGGGAGTTIADGTWHNVTIQTVPSNPGVDFTATWIVLVDGVQDMTLGGSGSITKSGGLWDVDTVGIFALVRNNGAAGFLTNCLVDDFAEWNRVLTPAEILDYMANGITNAGAGTISPLTVSAFDSDLYGVVQGTQVTMSWQVNADATGIVIDNGVGDVTSLTSCGTGSKTITVNANTTYTLTVARAASSATKSLTVTTVSGVAPNWSYVGGFNEFASSNNLANQGNWQSVFSSPQTANYGAAQVLPTVTGNKILSMSGTPVLSAGILGSHSIAAGNTNTVFFRFYLAPSINDPLSTVDGDPNFQVIPDVDVGVGASELSLFDVVTFSESDKGPALRLFRQGFGNGGPIDMICNFGAQSTSGFSWISSIDPNGVQPGVVYNVWMDIYNNQNDPNSNVAQYYGVTVQIGGDSGTVTNLFTYQPSDETTNHNETLNKVFIALNKAITPQSTNGVRMDDFYVSTTGANHTLPVPQGSFIVGVPPAGPTSINITSASKSGSSVTLNWSPAPAGSYSYTVWSRASLTTGSWTTVQAGINATTYIVTGATADQAFYKVSSP